MCPLLLTSGNLRIAPFQLERLLNLKIVRKINEHTRLNFTGIILEEDKDRCIRETTPDSIVEVNQISFDNVKLLLFKGIISKMDIKMIHDVYYIEVEAVSLTQRLDSEMKSRSFQNQNMKYEELMKQVVYEYDGDVRDEVTEQKRLGKWLRSIRRQIGNF